MKLEPRPPSHTSGDELAPALVFSQTVDGLFRALRPLSQSAKDRFRALGVDPDQRLDPAYPVEQWLKMMQLGVELFAPGRPFEEGIYALGRRFVDGYGETMVGKAMLVGMRLLGPERTLARFSRNLKTGSTFFESTVTPRGAGCWELWINRVTWPGWYFGLVEGGLTHAGARGVKVSLLSHEGPGLGARLLVSWADA